MKTEKEDLIIEMLRQTNSRIDDLKSDISEVKNEIRGHNRKINKIYDDRKEVTVKFSRAFAGINAAFSMVVAILAVLIFGNK